MKMFALAPVLAAALLGSVSPAHADDHERGRHWGGEGRGGEGRWRQAAPQQAYPQQPVYPQQAYPQQVYPQQAYPQQQYPRQAYPVDPQLRYERRGGPPVYGPAPQYAPQPQWQAPPPQRWQGRGFRPGDVLPPQYRQRQFIVNDWRAHRLYAPPAGYVWIQPEPGSYLLIGNNGTIANMLVGQ